ncbi:uncharacterized protein A1O9_07626 [Exophiala aquamarina CBS 119918]|uniref:Heterokaryon incompatibility domain-containing protein n=1 Tax=Exophiala aquamarina CBS 119918 TaxID=1182545 RepID=A0A072PKJ4_9EURO|nr:uncharacterized protein A1O9_07626 [Exophiala aquamarina CBS 119918]KEF56045.1 hypothetical protein A1O9_07626 [Exophiala aquamarina CBS 119918]
MSVGQQLPSEPRQSIFRPRLWLQNCLWKHHTELCGTAADGMPRSLPKRLICIGNNQDQTRLIDDFGGKTVPYLALSYCWGPSGHITTKLNNYKNHLRSIPWQALPATYRDAIDFVRAIGYRYIWIDALCIIQDDLDDWNSEAARMGDIYGEAILVISAANANHVGFGFLNERSGSRTFKNKLQKGPGDPTHILVQEPTIHGNILGDPSLEQQWPVFRRAWTLQERLLATRLVHFAAGEIIWECATTCACECGHLEAVDAVTSRKRYDLSSLDGLKVVERANRWDELVLSYQSRHITKDKDRLSALSGLAARFQCEHLGRYVAGLWSNFILSMLLWEAKKGRRASEYVAPSWSWASCQGRLIRNDAIEHNSKFQAVLEEAYSEPSTADPYGAIIPQSGFIRLSSPTMEGVVVRSTLNGHPMIQLTPGLQAFLVSDVHLTDSQIGGTVKCMFLRGLEAGPSGRYVEALILNVSKNLVDYERLGVAHIRNHSFDEDQSLRKQLPLVLETIKVI